jgi:cytochrome c556
MKKAFIISLIAATAILAADKGVSKIKTMQSLEDGLDSIQRGLLYNDGSLVMEGVKIIKKNAADINAFNIKNEKDSNFDAKDYAATASKTITKLSEDIKEAYKDGDKQKVLEEYRAIQNECINCHKVIRKW